MYLKANPQSFLLVPYTISIYAGNLLFGSPWYIFCITLTEMHRKRPQGHQMSEQNKTLVSTFTASKLNQNIKLQNNIKDYAILRSFII